MRNMNKYDTMLALNKKRSEEKVDLAKKTIYKMLERNEKITVVRLIDQTGLSRGFFYKNTEVRVVLDRAMEQQMGMVNPKRYIGNIAQKRKIEILEEQVGQLQKEIALLQEENMKLKKALGKRALNTIKNL